MTPDELRTWREQAGLTQASLAAYLSVDRMSVSRWERGTRTIPAFLPLALETITQRLAPADAAPQSRGGRRAG